MRKLISYDILQHPRYLNEKMSLLLHLFLAFMGLVIQKNIKKWLFLFEQGWKLNEINY